MIQEKWISNAKGISIILMMLGSVAAGSEGIVSLRFVYGIPLVMFFLLSGYSAEKRDMDREYINSDFRRFMVPYFLACLIIMISDILNSYFIYNDRSISAITHLIQQDLQRSFFASGSATSFGAVYIGTRIGVIWLLPTLFLSGLLFRFLINKIHNALHLGIICAGLFIFGVISAEFIWFPFSIQSAMMAVLFIWIGYEIRQRCLFETIKWYVYIASLVILLLGIWGGYCSLDFAAGTMADIFLSVPVGLSGCVLIYLFARLDRHGKVLEFLGMNCIMLLCTHAFMLETRMQCMLSFLNTLGMTGRVRKLMLVVIETGFAIIITFAVILIKRGLRKPNGKMLDACVKKSGGRDVTIDIAKGILIILMIIGHFSIDSGLRTTIYSCHMAAFIFLSGYFYKSSRSISGTLVRMLKTFLIPYGVFVLCYILLNHAQWSWVFIRDTLLRFCLGMSFSKKILPQIGSVGNIYFILLLFVVRILYTIIDKLVRNEVWKWILVTAMSLLGVLLGNLGLWLPWSIDVACYALIFYKLGVAFRKYDLVRFILGNNIFYFIFAPVWVFMIWKGGMELAVRNYGEWGLVIIGAVSGTLVILMLSSYIQNHMPICREILRVAGNGSMVILLVQALIGSRVRSVLVKYISNDGFAFLVISTAIMVTAGILVYLIKESIKKKILRKA